MKFKTLVIIFLCFSKSLIAQDTLRVETVVDSNFKTPQYVAAYDDVFLSHQETKWLVKVDFMGLLLNKSLKIRDFNYWSNDRNPANGQQLVSVSFERKIIPSISINTQLSSSRNFLDHSSFFSHVKWAWTIEPRFYFRKKEEIKNAQSVNNLNGSYISFSLSKQNKTGEFKYAANYGFQKRIFNNWYFDYKFGLGFYNTYKTVPPPNFYTYSVKKVNQLEVINQLSLGWAIGAGKHKNVASCDIFRCFETEKSLWKADIRQILNLKPNAFSSSLGIGYEHKLNNSALSLNMELKGKIGHSTDPSFDLVINASNLAATIEPRYYYNLKKRISKGLSVNNLSGCYVSVAFSASNGRENWRYSEPDSSWLSTNPVKSFSQTQELIIMPKWGIQKRIFKYGFADFSLIPIQFRRKFYNYSYDGVKYNNEIKTATNSWQYSTIGKIPVPIADFKIGFAF